MAWAEITREDPGSILSLLRGFALLVGSLEHEYHEFSVFHILGIIAPIDFHIFHRGRYTTNQISLHVFCVIPFFYLKDGDSDLFEAHKLYVSHAVTETVPFHATVSQRGCSRSQSLRDCGG